jgi:hypothetical protein
MVYYIKERFKIDYLCVGDKLNVSFDILVLFDDTDWKGMQKKVREVNTTKFDTL